MEDEGRDGNRERGKREWRVRGEIIYGESKKGIGRRGERRRKKVRGIEGNRG